MDHQIKTLAKGKFGELAFCTKCKNYQFTFNNLFFQFTRHEFKHFKNYLFDIDTEYWEYEYPCPRLKRNIPLPTMQNNLVLLFTKEEIEAMKQLLSKCQSRYSKLRLDEIDYKLILN
jgi:hypothetical protein